MPVDNDEISETKNKNGIIKPIAEVKNNGNDLCNICC